MDKKFWAIVGVIMVLFVGFMIYNNRQTTTEKSPQTTAQPTSHIRGSGTAVTLVEYGDFQCPACSQYYTVLEQVYQKYSDTMTMQFRHFPLTSVHRNAYAASRAAEAASKQNKFWEMYQLLYSNQAAWSDSTNVNTFFDSYAKKLGLDVGQFQDDYISTTVNEAIKADMKAGQALNVGATPTFFVNGKTVETPPPTVEALSAIIDQALASANQQ